MWRPLEDTTRCGGRRRDRCGTRDGDRDGGQRTQSGARALLTDADMVAHHYYTAAGGWNNFAT